MNAARGNGDRVPFAAGENKIRHVIYIIKENRTYDQLFGDLAGANGEPSITMFGEDITPDRHETRAVNSACSITFTIAAMSPATATYGPPPLSISGDYIAKT